MTVICYKQPPQYPTIAIPLCMSDKAIAVGPNIILTPCNVEWSENDFEDGKKPFKDGYFHYQLTLDGRPITMHIHASQVVRSKQLGPKNGLKPEDIRNFSTQDCRRFISAHSSILSLTYQPKVDDNDDTLD